MRYIFYADVYFIQNFMIKVAVLYLAFYCNKRSQITNTVNGIGKICLASGVGTIFEIVGLMLVNNYNLFLLLVHMLEIPIMFIGLAVKEKRQLFQLIISGYFFTILINGVLEALWNQFGERGSYIFYLIFSCGAVIVGVCIWHNYTRMQKGIFRADILHRGNRVQIQGFYDSGNRLMDPYTKHGVHITSEQLMQRIGELDVPVYIPYKSLGNEADLLEVYYIDELIVEGEKQKISIKNCPLGVTKDKLFEGKKYQIILNEEVF